MTIKSNCYQEEQKASERRAEARLSALERESEKIDFSADTDEESRLLQVLYLVKHGFDYDRANALNWNDLWTIVKAMQEVNRRTASRS
jgi:hypothetical protein